MNAQYLLWILMKCWFFNEFILESVCAVSEVKLGTLRKNRTHAPRSLSNRPRSYLYLNYKETYGLRFDPIKITVKRQDNPSTWEDVPILMPLPSSSPLPLPEVTDVTTIASNEMQTVSISTSTSTTTTTEAMVTTMASPSSSEVSITTPSTTTAVENSVLSTERFQSNNRPQILSFSTLRNRINASKRQNVTVAVGERPMVQSSLKDTLKLIRKRIKQWLAFGTDPKASLINGQRFLNVFNVIKFENGPCTSTQEGLADMSGICYHDYQCTQMGGVSIDECADGLGVCCAFQTGCGQTTSQLESYFQNPGFPDASQDRLICTLTVELQDDVTQVRLDFILFELKAPTDGNCVDDQFYVAGQNLNNLIPTLCGINSGQHMYVEVENALDRRLFLSILTSSVGTRAFNVRVQQLKDTLAPNNCLQYYTETEGWFQTFNYDDTSLFVANRVPSYFNNLNYVICIKRQWNYCSTTYANEADDVEYDFQLINIDSEGTSVIPEKQAGIEIFSCNDDYISVNSIRLCGEKLNDASRNEDLTVNAVITDTTNGLNMIPVRTSAEAVGRGFRINYIQIPCEDQPITTEPPTESTEAPADDDGGPISKYKRRKRT